MNFPSKHLRVTDRFQNYQVHMSFVKNVSRQWYIGLKCIETLVFILFFCGLLLIKSWSDLHVHLIEMYVDFL